LTHQRPGYLDGIPTGPTTTVSSLGPVTRLLESSCSGREQRGSTLGCGTAGAARESGAAFGAFYERHFASVLAFFRRRTAGPEEAFDLAAEAFAAALSALPRYEPAPEPALAWLFAIARNKLSESLRKGRVQDEARRALAMEPVVLDDEAIMIVEQTANVPVLELLASLRSDQRQAHDRRGGECKGAFHVHGAFGRRDHGQSVRPSDARQRSRSCRFARTRT
jgi:RNA polymerase sigma factor (sigma-70 family)